jgi:hypothetical protein
MSVSLPLFFLLRLSVVLFEAKEFSPNGLAMRQKSRKKCLFEAVCIGHPESFAGLRSKKRLDGQTATSWNS